MPYFAPAPPLFAFSPAPAATDWLMLHAHATPSLMSPPLGQRCRFITLPSFLSILSVAAADIDSFRRHARRFIDIDYAAAFNSAAADSLRLKPPHTSFLLAAIISPRHYFRRFAASAAAADYRERRRPL
jgi:hypothetical protein